MRIEYVEPTANVILTLSEVSNVIRIMETHTDMGPEINSLKRDFKALYKQLTGKEYGTKGIDIA